jgi:hypothetical protein
MNLFDSEHRRSVANMQEPLEALTIDLHARVPLWACALKKLITPRSSVEVRSSEFIKNHLLSELPHAESQRWLPRLEPVDLSLGEVLYESGVRLSHVYFPTTAIISLLYVMENGASAEIAVVGNEGIVGISLFMGGESTTSRAVVQSAGKGFRLKA